MKGAVATTSPGRRYVTEEGMKDQQFAPIVIFVNEKGGVTKTSLTAVLSTILSVHLHYNVLVIGVDPQASIENVFGFLRDTIPDGNTTFDVLQGKCTIAQATMRTAIDPERMAFYDHRNFQLEEGKVPLRGPDIVPINASAIGADFTLKNQEDWSELLRDALVEPVRTHYDYIFIDCAPSLGALTSNAITAATHICIPIVPERLVVEGVLGLLGAIKQAKRKRNPHVIVAGFILSKVHANWKSHNTVAHELQELAELNSDLQDLHLKIFETIIKDNAEFGTSLDRHSLLVLDNAESDYARAYWYVLRELIESVGGAAQEDLELVVPLMKVEDRKKEQAKKQRREGRDRRQGNSVQTEYGTSKKPHIEEKV